MRKAENITNLQINLANLQNEITQLQQTKNNMLFKQNNTRHPPPLHPLGPLPKYYNWYY
jgi:hypothetical protein